MPQLDFFSIANQFTWGIVYFAIFYFLINYFIVPTIFASIFAREYFIKNSSSDNFENIYYSFTAFFIFNVFLTELTNSNSEILSEITNLNFNNFVVVSKLIEFEIAGLSFPVFEDFDTN
ncbi:MAG: hypothetical protein ACK52I_04925 [Pseudomonadota bacterium]|jgi:hypothetical protein|nr:hypothetical protein [Bacteroidota bacterium]